MKKYLILIVIPFVFLSCGSSKTVLLWSSNEEAASIAELYNNSNSEFRVIFQYKENLTASFMNSERKPDIVIGSDLQNNDIKSELISLDGFFRNSLSDGADIFQALTGGIVYNEEKRLLPISFAMSTVVFNKKTKRINRDFPSIELRQMLADSIQFNKGMERKGYSPLWDREFICTTLDLFGSSFTSPENQTIVWNQENLDSAMDFLREWNESNGGTDEMALFDNKYMYDNRIKILKEERILFTSMNSSEFMELSDNANIDLDFLYISNNFTLHPEDVVYGGISRRSGAYKASSDFFSWLMKNETQQMIIEESLINKSASFGILGGFSSSISFNDRILPSLYPRLKGKIPEPDYLLVQKNKPVDFRRVKDELIIPWAAETAEGGESPLSDALEKWEKLRIPY